MLLKLSANSQKKKPKDINQAYQEIGDPEKRRVYDEQRLKREEENERERAEEKARRYKEAKDARIRNLFESGDIKGVVREAKSLYVQFPDDTDCQNNYAALVYEWAKHLAENGNLKEAATQLILAAEHTLDDELKSRIRADLELLRGKGKGYTAPPPPRTPPRPAATAPLPPEAPADAKVIVMWLFIGLWSLGAMFAAATFLEGIPKEEAKGQSLRRLPRDWQERERVQHHHRLERTLAEMARPEKIKGQMEKSLRDKGYRFRADGMGLIGCYCELDNCIWGCGALNNHLAVVFSDDGGQNYRILHEFDRSDTMADPVLVFADKEKGFFSHDVFGIWVRFSTIRDD